MLLDPLAPAPDEVLLLLLRPTVEAEEEDEEEPDPAEHGVRQPVEAVVVDERDEKEDREGDDGVGGLPLEEELGIVEVERRLDGGRAVDHHDAEPGHGHVEGGCGHGFNRRMR